MKRKRKKPIKKILKEVYLFDKSSEIVKREVITPKQFLKITFNEFKSKTQPKRDWEIFQEKYLGKKVEHPTLTAKNQKEFEKKVLHRETVNTIKDIIKGKKKNKYGLPIPYIQYDKKGNPIGHEGRHTAKALHELGYKKIPVTKWRKRY